MEALQDGLLSRRNVLGRAAEFFDPLGLFEPVKLNLKLALSELNHLMWDQPVPWEHHERWKRLLSFMEAVSEVDLPRCIRPAAATTPDVRLLCLADAGERAGGCAIYAGYRLPNGFYSCRLVYAKSRLMRNTVPRNELEAVLLCAEASLLVQKAMGDVVKEVFYFSDSTIAISWILNDRKRLRMWTHNRVKEILNAIKWVVGGVETYPIYHIDSGMNMADMVTKPRQMYMADINAESNWQTGLQWMQLPSDQLPKTQVRIPTGENEKKDFESELFPEIFTRDSNEEDRALFLDAAGQVLPVAARGFDHFRT